MCVKYCTNQRIRQDLKIFHYSIKKLDRKCGKYSKMIGVFTQNLERDIRVRNLKFARNLKLATSKTLVNFMKKMMFLSQNWYFPVQKALIYYTFNKSHHNSFILLVFSHVANFRCVANFTFLTLLVLFYSDKNLSIRIVVFSI